MGSYNGNKGAMKYLFGAYGTNNVGDEAIFEGASVIYPNSIEIFVNKSFRENSVWYADILTGRKSFSNEADELIMGGGGLIHCRGAVIDYLNMAKIAKSQGLKFSIQRVGFEGLKDDWKDVTIDLLKEASIITVRSKLSKKIVNELGFEAEVERDFAYEYNPKLIDIIPDYILPNNNKKNIGFVLSHSNDEQLQSYSSYIKIIMKYANVIFIPHSRAYVSHRNNDLVAGHKLWSMSSIWEHKNVTEFGIVHNVYNPREVLSIYSKLDGIFSGRYHGYVFAEKTNIPLIAKISGLKSESFLKESEFNLKTVIEQNSFESETLLKLEEWVKGIV
jgi:polysaccharide pyruvyl transferase WcaK-like protein